MKKRTLPGFIAVSIILSLLPLDTKGQNVIVETVIKEISLDDAYTAYENGDYSTAVDIWKTFAEQGNIYAQENLAYCYKNGVGVEQSDTEAIKWFNKIAEKLTLDDASEAFDEGDISQSIAIYRIHAELGNTQAQLNLGILYNNFMEDEEEAMKWWKKAAEQGYGPAFNSIGSNYEYSHVSLSFSAISCSSASSESLTKPMNCSVMSLRRRSTGIPVGLPSM